MWIEKRVDSGDESSHVAAQPLCDEQRQAKQEREERERENAKGGVVVGTAHVLLDGVAVVSRGNETK
jgi:hypothetical protein